MLNEIHTCANNLSISSSFTVKANEVTEYTKAPSPLKVFQTIKDELFQ